MRRSVSTTKASKSEGPACAVHRVEDELRWGRAVLEPSPTSALDAQLLLAQTLNQTRVWVLSHPEEGLTVEQTTGYRDLIRRRAEGEPVAYLRGWTEWNGLRFDLTSDVLVPRPETELLLEEAVALAVHHNWIHIADIGTGSGAIAIGLALALPGARIVATDVSRAALDVARGNAHRHGVADSVTFVEGDLTEPVSDRPQLIVANLPYLSDEMMASLDRDVRHEPVGALHGGSDGLALLERLRDGLGVRGWRVPLLLEIDPRQSSDARVMFAGDGEVTVLPDYAGHNRIVKVVPESL